MRDPSVEDVDLVRAHVEVFLLSKGIPYDALERAPEERVVRWFVVARELMREEAEASRRAISEMMGG